MARAKQQDGLLRGCPTCGTKVTDTQLGLRDYRWVNEALPGKVGGMDFDFVISQAPSPDSVEQRTRMLVLEFKPPKACISVGAALTFKGVIEEMNADVWVVWDYGDRVKVGECDATGRPQNVRELTRQRLAVKVRRWWAEGYVDG